MASVLEISHANNRTVWDAEESLIKTLARDLDLGLTSAETRVFWDLEDFPVPHGRTINSFPTKIKRSLCIEGYCGDVSFMIYSGNKSQKSQDHLRIMEIDLAQEADDKAVRLNSMLLDMVNWAYRNPPSGFKKRQVNFIVIAKDFPKEEVETEFSATLGKLEERGYNVFLVVPDDSTLAQAPFPDATLVWHWKKLFDGGEASFPLDSDYDCEEESSHGVTLFDGGQASFPLDSDYDCEEESSHGVTLPMIFDDDRVNEPYVIEPYVIEPNDGY